jgi:hypothetical protein
MDVPDPACRPLIEEHDADRGHLIDPFQTSKRLVEVGALVAEIRPERPQHRMSSEARGVEELDDGCIPDHGGDRR